MGKIDNDSLTRHHVIPTSRGGSNDDMNILIKTHKEHTAWHIVFGNATPEEAIETIRKYWSKGGQKNGNYRNYRKRQD